ncbi:GntR family transcriptional regulator [Alcaligenaceae bacterium]|nr:GntR family transcriptional regulator [Alcaligenaceae bacterium]
MATTKQLQNKQFAHRTEAIPTSMSSTPVQVAQSKRDSSHSRSETAYQFLYDGIRSRRFTGDTRLVEEDIAKELGVSRTPVRQALHQLQARGLVETRQGRGFFVVKLSRSEIFALYEFREAIEGTAARFAAQHATAPEINTLRHLNVLMLESRDDYDRIVAINRQFHQALNEASHNKYLIHSLNELHDTFALMQVSTFSIPGRVEATHAEHEAIIEAVESRDGDKAEQLLRSHVRKALELRLTLLD